MTNVATIIARLVDEIPPERLKTLVIDLMTGTTPAPKTPVRRPGRKAKPKVDARLTAKQRYVARRSAKRAAVRAEKVAAKAAPPTPATKAEPIAPRQRKGRGGRPRKPVEPAGSNNGASPRVTPEALWKQALRLAPTKPWTIVASEFGLNAAVALDSYRSNQLPPNLNQVAAARFLEMRPG